MRCSKNTEHCFQRRDLFWSCTSQILTTGVKTAPGSVTDSSHRRAVSGWSCSALRKNWKASSLLPAPVKKYGGHKVSCIILASGWALCECESQAHPFCPPKATAIPSEPTG